VALLWRSCGAPVAIWGLKVQAAILEKKIKLILVYFPKFNRVNVRKN
jgi:hypothetical protein